MWIFIILVVVAVILFRNYNSDKKELHSRIKQKGGMELIFQTFINNIQDDFKEHKIILNTNTELEISATTHDSKIFYFGIKLGFGEKVIYRCDTKRSNFLNADIAVDGYKSDQVFSYMMILDELKNKYTFITNDEQIINEISQSNKSTNDSLSTYPPSLVPTDEPQINTKVESAERPDAPLNTNFTKKPHLFTGDRPIRMISISDREFIIILEDFTERKFDVLGIQISEDSGNTFNEVPRKIDQDFYHLMVFNIDRTELDSDSFVLYLDCTNNIRCEMLFYLNGFPSQFAVIDQNKSTISIHSVVENIDHLRSRIRREED